MFLEEFVPEDTPNMYKAFQDIATVDELYVPLIPSSGPQTTAVVVFCSSTSPMEATPCFISHNRVTQCCIVACVLRAQLSVAQRTLRECALLGCHVGRQ